MAKTRSASNVNYGFQGNPSEQRFSSMQNSELDGDGLLMNNPYDHKSSQNEGPQFSNIPRQGVKTNPTNDQPGPQEMARDTNTPIPTEKKYQKPIGIIIISRVISALFILLDISLGWIQVVAWDGSTKIPDWLNFLEIVNSIKGSSPAKAQCSQGSQSLTSTYTAFCAVATAYGLARIVNMVGETIIEYNKQRPSESEPRFRGYQIIHGWVETALGMVCDDLPQAILVLCFGLWCQLDYIVAVKVFVWMLIKSLKNGSRVSSCKQHYEPLCDCRNCCVDCCMYSFNFVCCIFYFRPCACTGDGTKKCFEVETFDICPIVACRNDGECCGEIEDDPKWAKNLYLKLTELFTLVYIAMIILTVVRDIVKFNIVG